MSTESIFHNIIINDPIKIEAFVAAIEASIADPAPVNNNIDVIINPSKEEIRRIHELRHNKNRKTS